MIVASRAAGLALALFAAACASAPGGFPNPGVPVSAADKARSELPLIPGARFHHVHLNTADREASIDFYTRRFKAERARYAGRVDAVWAQRAWLLAEEVDAPPAPQAGTAIAHYGWGAPDAEAEFARQQALGATFDTEIRDISAGLGGPPGTFFFMYVEGPDGELIEINTDPDDNFGHLHLRSADPLAAGQWWANMFGLVPMPPYYDHLVVQTGSGRTSRQFFDNMLVIIGGAAEGAEFRSTLGAVTDHVGVAVPDLDAAMAVVRQRQIPILEEVRTAEGGAVRAAMIEGPDRIAIELIEDHTQHPPITD